MFSNSINRHSHERITTDAQLNRIITHNYNAQLTHKTMKKREKRKGTNNNNTLNFIIFLLFSRTCDAKQRTKGGTTRGRSGHVSLA